MALSFKGDATFQINDQVQPILISSRTFIIALRTSCCFLSPKKVYLSLTRVIISINVRSFDQFVLRSDVTFHSFTCWAFDVNALWRELCLLCTDCDRHWKSQMLIETARSRQYIYQRNNINRLWEFIVFSLISCEGGWGRLCNLKWRQERESSLNARVFISLFICWLADDDDNDQEMMISYAKRSTRSISYEGNPLSVPAGCCPWLLLLLLKKEK